MSEDLTGLTTKIVAAYLANNSVAAGDIPDLIGATYSALVATESPVVAFAQRQEPAVSIRKSVTPSAIICLECGEPLKMLKKHLHTAHDLSVDGYRAKWSLPRDYPVVAPDYAAHRSKLAINIGLGRKRTASEAGAEPVAAGTPQHSYPASRWSKPSE